MADILLLWAFESSRAASLSWENSGVAEWGGLSPGGDREAVGDDFQFILSLKFDSPSAFSYVSSFGTNSCPHSPFDL